MRIILLILLVTASCYGAGKGEGGGSIFCGFNLGVGVRARALGDTYVAVADDALSMYWNTAGLVNVKGRELYLAYHKFLVDITHQYLVFAQKVANNSSMGLSLYLIDYGEIEKVEETGDMWKPIGKYEAKEGYIGLGYSFYVNEEASLGGQLKFIRQRIDTSKLNTIAIDLGSLWKLTDNLSLGIVINNIGGRVGEDRLQSNYKIGLAHRYNNRAVVGILTAMDATVYSDKSKHELNIGSELSIYKCFFVRAGYKCYRYQGSNKFSVGGGLQLRKFLQLDFVYLPYSTQEEKLYNYSVLLKF